MQLFLLFFYIKFINLIKLKKKTFFYKNIAVKIQKKKL